MHQGQNMIQGSKTDFLINPDTDVCRIAPKMYWVHFLVGVSHFANAKYIVTGSSAVAERPRDALCPSVASFNTVIHRAQSFIIVT